MVYKECIKIWREGAIEELLNNFYIKSTYSNIKIENKKITLRDVESVFRGENIIEDWNVSKKIIENIENHKNLCQNLLKLIKENNSKLSVDLIKYFHNALMKDYFIDELIVKDEKIVDLEKENYVDGTSSKIDDKLQLLIEEINNAQINGDNILKVVSYFYLRFEHIYPFKDGRVGRMLINYLLIANNLPPIVIFYNNIEEYYLALEYFDETEDVSQMVKFLEYQAYKTWIKNYNLKLKSLKQFLE